jgi:hypothetical protein
LFVLLGDGNFSTGSNWQVKVITANPGVGAMNTNNRLNFGPEPDTLTLQNGMNMRIDGSGQTFTLGQTYDYVIASNVDTVNIGTVNFQPINFNPAAFASPSNFSLMTRGSNLILSFTAVPEPVAVVAVFLAGFAGAEYFRRRRARAGQIMIQVRQQTLV